IDTNYRLGESQHASQSCAAMTAQSLIQTGIKDFFIFESNPRRTNMKLLKIIIRNEKFEEVKESLTAMHVTGMTVMEVRGHGRQKGHKAVYRGTEYSVT